MSPAARPGEPKRRPRLGLRAELLSVLPLALLLLVALSTFTLFSYRSALQRLAEERQAEAERLARGAADRLVAAGAWAAPPAAERLRELAPGVRGIGLLDAAGRPLAVAGELAPLPAPAPARAVPFAAGPDAELPDGVAAFVPLVVPGRAVPPAQSGSAGAGAGAGRGARAAVLWVRVDLPAVTLGAQLRAIRLLSWLVLPLNSALVLLVLLFLRHLLTPYETLLARARQLGQQDEAVEDEAQFLIATLERALEALGERQGAPPAGGQEGRRLDADLAALERTLAASLESGLLLLGRDGRVLSLNPLGATLLGAPAAAAGTPLAELLAPHPEVLALLDAAIAGGRPVQRQECTLRRSDGEAVTLGLSVHPLRRDDGATRGYLVLFADLTEARRRAEESRLAERLTALGEMAAGVAHELRNSLATLRGYLTLIERRPDEESIADFMAEIRHEADHLQRVLEDFLAFARPGTARLQLFSLLALVRRAAADPALAGVAVEVRADTAEFGSDSGAGGVAGTGREAARGEAAGSGGTGEGAAGSQAGGSAAAGDSAAAGAGEAWLRGDPQLIERALRNVLHNAAQAEREAGRGGPIEVTIEETPAGIEVMIDDRGPGVPRDLRERLFHPFATGRAGGVGLGLALAHRILTLHGGRIRLENRPGGGTRARLTFPHDTLVTIGSATPALDASGQTSSPSPSH